MTAAARALRARRPRGFRGDRQQCSWGGPHRKPACARVRVSRERTFLHGFATFAQRARLPRRRPRDWRAPILWHGACLVIVPSVQKPPLERRVHRRVELEREVVIELAEASFSGRTLNVSVGGMALQLACASPRELMV